MRETLIVAGVLLAGWALRTYGHSAPRKVGALAFLFATYLAGWFLTGAHIVGVLAVAAWFFLPWLEILTRIRHLRLPLDKHLRSAFPPSSQRFPQLSSLTAAVEAENFESVEDTTFEWSGASQFMRLFYHRADKQQAAICLLEQGGIGVVWLSLSAKTPDERTWRTWNYPFSHTMKLAPDTTLNVVNNVDTFEDLMGAHRDFLDRQGLTADKLADQDPESFVDILQRETRRQVDHNLDQGLIELSGEGTFRYSWRGYLYLWRQFLRDMVRLS
ncbi:MAG: hypothetical protein ACR2OZ_15665 [Verrucomicrobiales bacterium]